MEIFSFKEVCGADKTVSEKINTVNSIVLSQLKRPSNKAILEILATDGMAIQFVKNPSRKMWETALASCGMAIMFHKNPSDKLCMIAAKQDCRSIMFIKNLKLRGKIALRVFI